jgi:hypothetical protein
MMHATARNDKFTAVGLARHLLVAGRFMNMVSLFRVQDTSSDVRWHSDIKQGGQSLTSVDDS